ncbi:MAG: hypothetical protein N2235_02430 [Fischerella sp.]|nr:hypothetical protein [Fischerella sp.]
MNYTNNNVVDVNVNNNPTTQKYFNNFFNTIQYDISGMVNDTIIGYFQKITDTPAAARALASAVIYTAINQNIDPLSVLEEFKKKEKQELNGYLLVFLNLNRYGTSYLGVTNTPNTNKYITRTLLP